MSKFLRSKEIINKNPDASFELEKNQEGLVTPVVWYNLEDDDDAKQIEATLAWSVRKVDENRKASK